MSGASLRKPTDRTCELCGRREAWDEDVQTWRVATTDGEQAEGKAFCIHEWDINGRFAPFDAEE